MRVLTWAGVFLGMGLTATPSLAVNCDTLPPPHPFVLDSVHVFQIDTVGGTDCWGWTSDDGTDYALFGVYEGIAIFNTVTMQHVTTIPGPTESCSSIRWRDIKSYRNYCYAVSECTGVNAGMMIMDMQYLPDSVHFVGSYMAEPPYGESHNFSIDTATGFAYIQEYAGLGGFYIVDLSDPVSPTLVHKKDTLEIHDLFARNDTLWVAEGGASSYSMWNVSNKQSPKLITRIVVPTQGYAHNIWPTEDGRYAVTTEENRQKQIKIWDFQDPNDVRLVGQVLAPDYIAHNAHVYGDYLIVSHYSGGVYVVDLSEPECPREVARFDTWYKPVTSAFSGCWGVYPNTRSGQIYGANTDGRLFVLQSNIVQPRIQAEPRVAWAPVDVQFTDRSTGMIDSWTWDFGDGSGATTPNSMHTYSGAGVFDVSLSVEAFGDVKTAYEPAFVTVLTETLVVDDTVMQAGDPLVWEVYGRNGVPLTEVTLPFNLSNAPATVRFQSVSFVGTRFEVFDEKNVLVDNRNNGKFAIRLRNTPGLGTAPLPPGSGVVARIYCTTDNGAAPGDTVALTFDPLGVGGAYTLKAKTLTTDFTPVFTPAVLRIISCDCPAHGDVHSDGVFDSADLNELIDYIFFNQPQPPKDPGCLHIDRGDFNCDGFDNSVDLNYLINVIFFNGPDPCQPCDCHGYPSDCGPY